MDHMDRWAALTRYIDNGTFGRPKARGAMSVRADGAIRQDWALLVPEGVAAEYLVLDNCRVDFTGEPECTPGLGHDGR